MPRIARKQLNTPYLHVMVQGINKEYIFNKEKYIELYLEIMKKNKKSCKFTIMAYCIMNNHAHILVYAEDIKEFGKFMQKTNLKYTQMYNKDNNRCGVLFRNRYLAEPIYDEKYLVNCIKYIHNNPVKAKMVSKCEEYKYSSYNDFIKNTGVAKSKIIEGIFGKNCDFLSTFNHAFEKRFIDANEKKIHHSKEYILEGIREYKQKTKIEIISIFMDKLALHELILFLVNECGIKYSEIQNFFGISDGAFKTIKKYKM